MKTTIKTCSCPVCRRSKRKKAAFKAANRRLRKTGKSARLKAELRDGKTIDIPVESTGFIG